MRTMSSRTQFASVVSLVAIGALGAAQGGCSSSPVANETSVKATKPHVAFQHTEIKATPETTAATGITHWWFYKRAHVLVFAGLDANGVKRSILRTRIVNGSTEFQDDKGMLRVDSKGSVLIHTLQPESVASLGHLHRDFRQLELSNAKIGYDACSDAMAEAAATIAMLGTCPELVATGLGSVACLAAVALAALKTAQANQICSGPPPSPVCASDADCPSGTSCMPDGTCQLPCGTFCPGGYACDPSSGQCLVNDCGGYDCGSQGMTCDPYTNSCSPVDSCSVDPYGAGCDPCAYDPSACGGGGGGGGSYGGGYWP